MAGLLLYGGEAETVEEMTSQIVNASKHEIKGSGSWTLSKDSRIDSSISNDSAMSLIFGLTYVIGANSLFAPDPYDVRFANG